MTKTPPSPKKNTTRLERDESYFVASQWVLMRRKFFRHRLAIIGMIVVGIFYFFGIFAEFMAPHDPNTRFAKYLFCPPQKLHFVDESGKFYPGGFVYKLSGTLNRETFVREYVEDKTQVFPLKYFSRGEGYRFWGLFRSRMHFVTVAEPGVLFLFGTDDLGRDLYSRNIHATRLSLSIGLVGVLLSFVLGCILGGIAGYYGGVVDMVIQRFIEFLLSIPRIPLWLALAAALPADWPVVKVYFGITVVLATIGWTGLARVVRGKLLQLRGEDFVMAAKISNMSDMGIIGRHLLPSFMSYLIVNITLRIPNMILGETALSFLGVGMREPAVSWGVLLQGAQNVRTIALHPWLLLPALFVIAVVLAINFLGDGLRDAADPYK